jgi:DNA methylase
MTTDPGDLVLDITCGSGTTAYVAEQWGRRWITCDTEAYIGGRWYTFDARNNMPRIGRVLIAQGRDAPIAEDITVGGNRHGRAGGQVVGHDNFGRPGGMKMAIRGGRRPLTGWSARSGAAPSG